MNLLLARLMRTLRECVKKTRIFYSQADPKGAELQKRADRADQSVQFFLAGANFWEKHAKNRQKHAKTGKKQALFWC